MPKEQISKEQLAAYEMIYGTGWRQLRRWFNRGTEKKKPCPLDNPRAMPIWWATCMRKACPEKILQAARDAGASDVDLHGAQDRKAPVLPEAIDLAKFDPDEGEPVRFQRQIVAALAHQLSKAYANRQPVDLLQSQYNKAVKALRELSRDDREDRAHRDKYIPRDIYERDATTAADMLRRMHDTGVRFVMEICPSLTKKQRPEVEGALRRFFGAQSAVFKNFSSVESVDDLLMPLKAA